MSKSGAIDNNKEMIDVVDENDNVIGQMLKGDAHNGSGALHREIAVLIFDVSGNLLLQQRSFKKKYFPGLWSVAAAGHVMSGQTPEEAAHMELQEELGFDTELKFVERKKYTNGDHVSLGFLFTGAFPRGVMINPDRDEVENAKFVSKADMAKMMANNEIDPYSIDHITKFFDGKFGD